MLLLEGVMALREARGALTGVDTGVLFPADNSLDMALTRA